VRLGLSVPTARPDGLPLTGDMLVGSARQIEEAGFDSAWFFDAIGRGFILPDPLIGAAVAAAVTRRIEIGTGVLQVPLRNPVELAHRILTVHLISRGRLLLGVITNDHHASRRRRRHGVDAVVSLRRSCCLWRKGRLRLS